MATLRFDYIKFIKHILSFNITDLLKNNRLKINLFTPAPRGVN